MRRLHLRAKFPILVCVEPNFMVHESAEHEFID